MFNKIIICSFILFLFVIIIEHFIRGGTILEGLDSDAKALMTTPETPAPVTTPAPALVPTPAPALVPTPSSPIPSSSDIGVTVGTYGAKLDSLGKIIDSMQSGVLGLLPIVIKNASDNQKNSEAIQAIIENKDKT
jgi:hypothetical protein